MGFLEACLCLWHCQSPTPSRHCPPVRRTSIQAKANRKAKNPQGHNPRTPCGQNRMAPIFDGASPCDPIQDDDHVRDKKFTLFFLRKHTTPKNFKADAHKNIHWRLLSSI